MQKVQSKIWKTLLNVAMKYVETISRIYYSSKFEVFSQIRSQTINVYQKNPFLALLGTRKE